MPDSDRFALLFGPYRTPRFKYGRTVADSVRGDVVVVGLTDARIPWPIGKRGRAKSLVVFGALERAIRRESNQAVCHWWGITPQTVTKWRSALGIETTNAGTSRLRPGNSTAAARPCGQRSWPMIRSVAPRSL